MPARDVAQPNTANGPTPDATWGPAAEWGSAAGGKWTLEEVGRFLAEYGRPQARLEASPLAGGWENLNLRVDAAGERFVLRRYDSTDPAEVPWEIELLRYLGERGFPTPAPLPQRDGRLLGTFGGRPAALFPFVEGRHPHWDDPRAADAAADVIARLHVVTAGLALPFPRSRTDVHARLERFRTWVGEHENSRHATVLRPLAEEAERYWAEFSERLECVSAAHGPLPRGVVHSDAHGNNLLFDSEGRLTRTNTISRGEATVTDRPHAPSHPAGASVRAPAHRMPDTSARPSAAPPRTGSTGAA